MIRKYLTLVILSLSSSLTMLISGCGSDVDNGKPTIAFVGYSTSLPFWIGLRDAAKAEAEAQGMNFLDLTSAEPDPIMQKQAVDNAIARKVDGILIGAVDSRAFNDSLNRAQKAGIPVAAVDTGIEHPWISFLIQTDNLKAAGVAGEYIVDQGAQNKVLINGGTVGHQTGNARRDGVKNVVESAGGEVIFRSCDWLPEAAYETTLNELTAHPDITAVFSASDPMALSAIAAAKEKGLLGKILIVGFDGDPANLKAIKNGAQSADIKQDNIRMGREGVANLAKVINGHAVEKFIPVDGILITQENVGDYL